MSNRADRLELTIKLSFSDEIVIIATGEPAPVLLAQAIAPNIMHAIKRQIEECGIVPNNSEVYTTEVGIFYGNLQVACWTAPRIFEPDDIGESESLVVE